MGVLEQIRCSVISGILVQHQVALLLPPTRPDCLSAGEHKADSNGTFTKLKSHVAASLHEHQGAPHPTFVAGELG